MKSITVKWLDKDKQYKVTALEQDGEEVIHYVDSVLELAILMGKLEEDNAT